MPPVTRSQRAKKVVLKAAISKKRRLSAKGTSGGRVVKKTFLEKRLHLENMFAQLNTELRNRQEENENNEKYNVFNDILKVAPVVDLLDEDKRGRVPALSASATIAAGESHERRKSQKMESIGEEEDVIIIDQSQSTSSISDDMDMRQERHLARLNGNKSKVTKKAPISAESVLLSVGGTTTKTDDVFISRVRYALRSPPIDTKNANYELTGLRYFQDIKGQHLYDSASNEFKPFPLRVVSFNVLCQHSKEKTQHLYTHLNNDRRRIHGLWEGRMPKLTQEFDRLRTGVDIFCLQEVQDCHYEEFYKPYFEKHGYKGFFTPRRGQNTPDGCAVFWCNRLEVLRSRHVHYNLSVQSMDKDNCGQILLFGLVGTGTRICVSNTHIYYNMKRGEVKLAQMAYLLASMHQVSIDVEYALLLHEMEVEVVSILKAVPHLAHLNGSFGEWKARCASDTTLKQTTKIIPQWVHSKEKEVIGEVLERADEADDGADERLKSPNGMESEFSAEYSSQSTQNKEMSNLNYGHFAGHILCGDFNMEPASPLHRFVLNGTVNLGANTRFEMAHELLRDQQQQQPFCSFTPALPLPANKMRISARCIFVEDSSQVLDIHKDQLRHPFSFASVYEYWNALGEREISTHHGKDSVQPDFIFYSVLEQKDILSGDGLDGRHISEQEKLLLNSTERELVHEAYIQLRRRLSLPTLPQLKCACGALPNEQYGSDHLSLLAHFDVLSLATNGK